MAKIWDKKTVKELIELVKERTVKLRTFRFNVAGSKITNVKEAKGLRREIAQLLTALKAKNQND